MQSREGKFSQQQNTWKERIKKRQTGKEYRSKDWCSFHSLVHLPVKPWQCESTCRSFAVLDSVLIRDRRASVISVTMAVQKFRSNLQNKFTKVSHRFHWAHRISTTQLGAPWWSLSLSVKREALVTSNIAIFQHRQLN